MASPIGSPASSRTMLPAGVTSVLSNSASAYLHDLNVTIGSITHTYTGDLTIDLTSPGGTMCVALGSTGLRSGSRRRASEPIIVKDR